MKEIFINNLARIKEIPKQDLSWNCCLVFAFTIPISQFVSVRLIILTLIISLIIVRSRINYLSYISKNLDVLFFLFVIVLGLLYTFEFPTGLGVIETNFSMVGLSFVFFTIRMNEDRFYEIFVTFIKGLFLSCLICLLSSFLSFFKTCSLPVFLFDKFTSSLDFQPTYFAYYLVFAITFGLYLLKYKKSNTKPWIIASLIFFFFLILMLTGGRTSFISLLLVFSFFLLSFFLDEERISQIHTFSLIVAMMLGMFATTFYEKDTRTLILNDSWDRYDLWKSAISANTNFLFGVGTGDYKVVLNEYFRSHNMKKYAADSLNSHNQFIQTYLSNGLLGLVAIIFLLGRPLYSSFMRGYPLGILVFFPFLLYGMTEVFLGRYQGVVFFAFLHQAFIAYLASSKPTVSLKSP